MDFNHNWDSSAIYFIPYGLHAINKMFVVDFPWIKNAEYQISVRMNTVCNRS